MHFFLALYLLKGVYVLADECAHFPDESCNRDAIKNQANASDEKTSNEAKERHMAVPSISRKIQTIFYKTNGIWKSKELSNGKLLDTEKAEGRDMHTSVNADSQNRKMVTEEATKTLGTKRINRSKIQYCKRHKRSKLFLNENIDCNVDSTKARSHSKKHIKGTTIIDKHRKAVTILVNEDLVPNSMHVMSPIDTGANGKVVKPQTNTLAQQKIAKPPSVSVKLEEYKDSYCTEEFVSVDPMLKGKPVNEKQFTRYLCKLCSGFRTESTDALEMHIMLHVNNKLNCHTCEFVANTKQNLACHVKQEHKTHRYIICEHCGFELYNGRMYKDHLSKQHNKAGFECDECELSFFTSNDYRQHKLRTHPESTFKCEKCGAIYLWKIALENHQKHKTDCEMKKYTVLQYCNFKSLCKGTMLQHVKRVHFKSKIYKCSMCPYTAVGSD